MFSGRRRGFTLTLATSVARPDIPALASAAGWDGASPLTVNITAPLINTLIVPAAWSFPGELKINVGASTRIGGVFGGGPAMIVRQPLTLNNLGTISGGGGQGGKGQGVYCTSNMPQTAYANGGVGGGGQGFANASSLTVQAAQPGASGEYATASSAIGPSAYAQGGQGGAGGGWGNQGFAGNGGAGGNGSWGEWKPATAGSPAGAYLDGSDFVTWAAVGTRQGGLGSGAYRYYRLLFDSFAAALQRVAFYEFELRSTPGGADITNASTPVSGGATFGGQLAAALDDNPTTYWTAWGPQYEPSCWFQIDLGTARLVRQIAIAARVNTSTTPPAGFKVLVSNDGNTFAEIASFSGIAGWTDGQQRLFNV